MPSWKKPNLDHEASKVYRSDRGVLDLIADVFETPDQTAIFLRAETEIAAVAEKSELRERASTNARSTLTDCSTPSGCRSLSWMPPPTKTRMRSACVVTQRLNALLDAANHGTPHHF